ncbi:MAG: 3-oxoacyl-[acyl-carrier-protein] synthase III C-terminal domain-containing protein [Acidobacteriota bacterium]
MKILNISYTLPSKKVSNDDLIKEVIDRNRQELTPQDQVDLEARFLRFFKMSGSKFRFHRAVGEKALTLAVDAGKKALSKAGVKPEEVDLLIYAGVTRGWIEPATANLFQSELGLKSATCFDVLDACASWIRAMEVAKTFIAQKIYKMVMIVNCECGFREYANFDIPKAEDLEHSFSGFTIGEAATATLLTVDDEPDDSIYTFKTWGGKHGLCKIPLPNASEFSTNGDTDNIKPLTFFTSPGELLSFTIRKLVGHFNETRDIADRVHNIVFGHSVSVASTSKTANMIGIDESSVFETHHRFGNTVSASLPLGMAVAEEEGRLKRGMQVLLLMGSAGVSTAMASFKY